MNYLLLVLVGLTGIASGDDRSINQPSLVGYVGDEIIVVLKEDYLSGLSSESPAADPPGDPRVTNLAARLAEALAAVGGSLPEPDGER